MPSWTDRGALVPLPEGRVFTVDLASGSTTPSLPVLVLHGFPTSSWDFAECATKLAQHRRVVLFDFLGFGNSDKPRAYGYSLFEQADVACAAARAHGLSRVHLWAHDMGTSVAAELLARRERGLLPFDVASLTLMNGSLHMEMAHLTLGQRILASPAGGLFARFSRRAVFAAQLRRIFGRPPSDETLFEMWRLVSRENGAARLPAIIRYMEERGRFRARWIGALERLDVPVLIGWGAKDPVARIDIAERLAREIPGAELVRWEDLGHFPQIEDPERVAESLTVFLAAVERSRPISA